jgi:hypothetical protein
VRGIMKLDLKRVAGKTGKAAGARHAGSADLA